MGLFSHLLLLAAAHDPKINSDNTEATNQTDSYADGFHRKSSLKKTQTHPSQG
jgi:hypothetical protein